MRTAALPAKAVRILAWLADRQRRADAGRAAGPWPPTFREEATAALKVDKSTAADCLRALRGAGLVRWEPQRPRTLRLLVWERAE